MKYQQRDIVEVNFMFPDGSFKPHPALIVSNDEMLVTPMAKQSYVKCQLLVGNIERDVIRKISRLKQPYFDEVIQKVIKTIF